ncbi:PREDICTED: uncharacterized protein LOC109326388 [Lupinus angustifolius]|uniref:uncharacterized protein LOC109326388 n=1 Tax=Lupinus angustifolius TaxID=3871 RepID=UPI00092F1DFD|nr:PREDICTED: uncharacterized protein LOC109326388 [Lupinus angustifolius]
MKFTDLKNKLQALWSNIGKWTMISLGKGFYDFAFSSMEDMRNVCAVGSWSLKPGFLRLFLWSPDFNLNLQKLSHTQCWIKIHNLPQEYWSPRILFSIAGGIGTPISLDEATHTRSFGHFARVLVELNLKTNLPEQILVEREGFAFFVSIKYENLPNFCQGCQTIGHMVAQCRRNNKNQDSEGVIKNRNKKTKVELVAPKRNEINDLTINLEIEKEVEDNYKDMERLVISPKSRDNLDSQTDNELDITRVENSAEGVESDSHSGNIIVQETEDLHNVAAIDSRIVGKLWADEESNEEEEEEFSKVLSRSQKKKMKKIEQSAKVYQTRNGGYLSTSK